MEILTQDVTDYQVASDAVSVSSAASGLSFIEQLQIFCKNPCTKERRPYLIGVNENAKVSVLTKPNCKMWNCEACAARNARLWITKIIYGINVLGGQWSFLTVTSHRKMRGSSGVPNIRQGWKKLYNRILSSPLRGEDDFHFAKIWEQNKDGSFHLHCLLNDCFGTRWAKDNAAECGLGFMSDWHEVDNAGKIAGYMAKYTLKNAGMARNGVSWPKGLRRIETSQKWPNLPDLTANSDIGWIVKFTREEQTAVAARYFGRGFEILDMVKE